MPDPFLSAATSAALNPETWKRVVAWGLGFGAALLAVVLLMAMIFFQLAQHAVESIAGDASGIGAALLRPPAGSGIPEVYWPMYTRASLEWDVSPFLLASIHMQESGFSTNRSVTSGWNGCGAAGPMQFGIVGVAPYHATVPQCPNPNGAGATWNAYKHAFRLAGARPASYPLDRRNLASCRRVPADTGCVYDDFDAVAAAAMKLSNDGADTNVRSEGTRDAVCAYIGSCRELSNCSGVNAYCNVLERAQQWQQQAAAAAPPLPGKLGSPVAGARLAWPVAAEFRGLTSPFGPRSRNGKSFHEGIDLATPPGTPIAAAETGRVELVCPDRPPCTGYGNFVCINHRPDLSTCYAHLSAFRRGLSVGTQVARGALIGASGNTGDSDGPHLHFEVRLGPWRSQPVDPLPYLGAAR